MLKKRIATALSDVDNYSRAFDSASNFYNKLVAGKVSSRGLVITEEEMINAEDYEARLSASKSRVDEAQRALDKARQVFYGTLPASVLEEMKEEGKAIQAFWYDQPTYATYGPYAAYFTQGKLIVEQVEEPQHFATNFEQMRQAESPE